MQDIRWKQRFNNLQAAYQKLQHAVQANTQCINNKAQTANQELIQMALIKAFEMTFELSWKTMKDYLNYSGIDVQLPRDTIKQAFANQIITNGQIWINMLEDRNLMTHTYSEARALKAVNHICQSYMPQLEQLHQYLLARS